MGIERRSLLAGGMLLISACAAAAPARRRDPAPWTDFRNRFLLPDGRVVDPGNGGISHSEGQGYGLVLAEAWNDRATFDRLLGWTEANLALPGKALYAWRFEPGKGVTDPNNATDGDILIAWALMRAGLRWGDRRYGERAAAVRRAILRDLVRPFGGRTLLLPGLAGFDRPERTSVNLSYYIWPALDVFAAADGRGAWGPVMADGARLLVDARAGALRLPTDWTDIAVDGTATPAADRPPRFGFDAIRIPLYLALGRRRKGAETIAGWWRSHAARGQPIPAWVDVRTGETAPYALSQGGYAVVRCLLGRAAPIRPEAGPPDYYSSVLKLLAALA